jgi:hypothetical protein
MDNLSQRIKDMDDFTVVRALEHLCSTLLADLDSDPEELLRNIPATVAKQPDFDALLTTQRRDGSEQLPADLSVKVARDTLLLLAQDPDLEPVVAASLESYKDNRAMAAEILSAGTAISMIIIAATTSVRFKGKNFSGKKQAATPAVLGTITELVKAVASVLSGTRDPAQTS